MSTITPTGAETRQEPRRTTIVPQEVSEGTPHKTVRLEGYQSFRLRLDCDDAIEEIDRYFAVKHTYPEIQQDVDALLHRIRVMLTP